MAAPELLRTLIAKMPVSQTAFENVTLECKVLVANEEGNLEGVLVTLHSDTKFDDNVVELTTDRYPGGDVFQEKIKPFENQNINLSRFEKLFREFGDGEEALLLKKGSRDKGYEGIIGRTSLTIEIPLKNEYMSPEGGADIFARDQVEDEEMGDYSGAEYTYSKIQCTPDGYTFTHKK